MRKINYLVTIILITGFTLAACSGSSDNNKEASTTVQEEGTEEPIATNTHIDPEKSVIRWRGEMLGMYAHEGTILLKEGYLYEEHGKLAGGSFRVDMKTITPTDDNFNPEEGKSKEKLVGHLSSDDFFNVENFSIAVFDIIEVGETSLKGNLYLRDKKGQETVENIKIMEEDGVQKLSGTVTFDRQKYNVAFKYPVQEMVISDDIQLEIELVTVKP